MSSPIIVQSGATPIIRPDNAIHSNLSGRSSADSHPTSAITGLDAALALKAPLASPALTGVPTAPTAAADTSTTQIATTAFAKAEADAAQAYAIQRANHTGTQTASTISDFSSAAQSAAAPVVQSANFTAASGTEYIAIATLTVTDPTPSVGANFIVHVRNGTATIGGVGYIAGQDVHRVWHSGSWNSTVQASLGTAQTWTALQTLGAGLTVSSGTTAMQAATCTTLTASGATTIDVGSGTDNTGYTPSGAGLYLKSTDASGFRLISRNWGSGAAFNITCQHVGGTRASPSASSSQFFNFSAFGYDGTSYSTIASANFTCTVDGTWSGTNRGTQFSFNGTSNGSTTNTTWMTLRNAIVDIPGTTASTSTTTGALTVAGGIGIAKEVVLTASSTGAVYWGPTATSGSTRMYGNGSGAVIFEKYNGSSWVEIGRFG